MKKFLFLSLFPLFAFSGNLNELLKKVNKITPPVDYKLQKLIAAIKDKINNPINQNNKKVIIFTAFADTADYLYENLSKIFKNQYQLNSTLITGSRRVTTAKTIPTELNAILNNKGSNLEGATIYVDLFPCNECAKAIREANPSKVGILTIAKD